MIGVSVGPVIGSLYKGLCGQQFDWFTVVIGLPCLLSGVTAAALGYGKTSWFSGVGAIYQGAPGGARAGVGLFCYSQCALLGADCGLRASFRLRR